MTSGKDQKGFVGWALRNSRLMNMLFLVVVLIGFARLVGLRREMFPNFSIDRALVSVPYPGASPEAVEEGVCQKVEEAVRSVEGVKKVTSVASEGSGSVIVEINPSVPNQNDVVDNLRSKVKEINFPGLTEPAKVELITFREPILRIGVLAPGKIDNPEVKWQLRKIAEDIHKKLIRVSGVSEVQLIGTPNFQIDVEIPERTLKQYGLTLQEVAERIRKENHELPAGSIRTKDQTVLLRGNNRHLTGEQIRKLPLVRKSSGAVLTVGDIGTVRDDFDDAPSYCKVNGRAAVVLSINRTLTEDLLASVHDVKEELKDYSLPPGFELQYWSDLSHEVSGRLRILGNSGLLGISLVFIVLALFLDLRLAFWVALGIPFSILASGAFLSFSGQTLNVLTLFGFIMGLGIVVDDAIVVGENIYSHIQMGKPLHVAAYDGAVEVMASVISSVTTTLIAFMPLIFVDGVMGKFLAVLPIALMAMLVASLFESLTVLPCHLAHKDSFAFTILDWLFYSFRWVLRPISWIQKLADRTLHKFIHDYYQPALVYVLHGKRIQFVSICTAVLIIGISLVSAGWVPYIMMPKADANRIAASVTFPDGTSEKVTSKSLRLIEHEFWNLQKRLDEANVGLLSYQIVGQRLANAEFGRPTAFSENVGSVEVELVHSEKRNVTSEQLVEMWRKEVGTVPGIETISFASVGNEPAGQPVKFKLVAPKDSMVQLESMVEDVKAYLSSIDGVFDVTDDSSEGKNEFRIKVKDEAKAIGISEADLAQTVRSAFYGQEVMRLQRNRHEVKLMVRYPKEDRQSLVSFDRVRITKPDGQLVPITEVADVEVVRAYSEINRVDQLRSITITANVNEAVANAKVIVQGLKEEHLPNWQKTYRDVQVRWEGQEQQDAESMNSLFFGLIFAMSAIYVLLAFQFNSYTQPVVIMLTIPFGFVGAVLGHVVMGLPLTLFSIFGLVALTGILINDSIVLIDFINRKVRDGMAVEKAVVEAGIRRFRPVILTSLTTIAGLAPLVFETATEAQFMIPMATSISFGLIVATILVLFLVPVYYSILADSLKLFESGETV